MLCQVAQLVRRWLGSAPRACARLTPSPPICWYEPAAADSLAVFVQLGMQPVQTVQAAEPVASGDMRPSLALRRNAAAVGTPAHWPYQHDTHHCSTHALTTTVIRGIGRSPCDCLDSLRRTNPLVGPETPSRRHTLQWPLLLMPGGNSRLRRREARWQDYNPGATVPHVVARCHRVHPAGSGGTCARPGVSTRHARHRNPAGVL
jgi:hypothetical protein